MRLRDPLGPFRRPSKAPAQAAAAPDWAGFFTAAEYAEFLGLIGAYFRARGTAFRIEEGVVSVQDDGSLQFGLANLAQMCHQQPRGDWARIIAGHFGSLAQARREEQEIEDLVGDFARVAPLLAVRLFPRAHLDAVGPDKLVFREDLQDTITTLVFDLPATVRSVLPEQTEPWGKTAGELLAIGLENVRRTCLPGIREVELAPDLSIRLISGVSFMTASHALLLDHHPGCVGRFGALVGVPHRHAVLCYPMADRRVVKAVARLLPAVSGMEQEGPGSISRALYWYRQGRFLSLPYAETPEGYRFMVPPEFVKVLEQMPPAPGGSGKERGG